MAKFTENKKSASREGFLSVTKGRLTGEQGGHRKELISAWDSVRKAQKESLHLFL